MAVDGKITWDTGEGEIRKIIQLIDEFGKHTNQSEGDVKDLEKALDKMGKTGKDSTDKVKKEFNDLESIGKRVTVALGAVFAVDQLIDYQKQIIQISAEYQRMEAVLTTALGSQSAAQIALAQIQNFAKNTPFQVNQLTDSFTKLANRGIIPANAQLKALGDFAATSGKDMDQLVEAILDVNNTERWTELGLKVRTEGDTIVGTFRGIEIAANRTEAGALEMVEAFGKMEGVAGSMEGISKTTGGAISNLEDAIDQLLNTIGQAESGVIGDFTRGLSDMVTTITRLIETDLQKSTQMAAEIFEQLRQQYGDLDNEEDYLRAIEEISRVNDEVRVKFDETKRSIKEQKDVLEDAESGVFDWGQQGDEARRKLEILGRELVDLNGEMMGNERTIEFLEKAMKKLGDTAGQTALKYEDFVISTSDQAIIDKMRQTREELERLEQSFNSLGSTPGDEQFDDVVNDMMDDANATMDDKGDEFVRQNERIVARTKREWDSLLEHRSEVVSGLVDLGDTLANSLFDINQADRERELEAIQADTEAKLALAGDNENRKAQILEEAQRREEQLREQQAAAERRQFLFEQVLALGEVWIQTRLAVAKAIALSPVTFGEPFAGYARAQGLLSAGIIAAQTIPAFAEGTERLEGPGTRKSDSILIRAAKDERIVSGDQNEQIGFDMSNKDLVKAAKLYRALPGQLKQDIMPTILNPGGVSLDPDALASKIAGPIVRQIKKQPGVNIQIDQHGAALSVVKDLERIKYLETRFGIKIGAS